MINNAEEEPVGELALRTLAMPANTNVSGDIFGGWLLSQMDIAGGMVAKDRAKGRVVTVAVDRMIFHRPVYVGDAVCCYCEIQKVGRTSITVKMQAWAIRGAVHGERLLVTEGVFTYVVVDEDGRPRIVGDAPTPAC
jgi:acyl-CoA thioesterase YciA